MVWSERSDRPNLRLGRQKNEEVEERVGVVVASRSQERCQNRLERQR